MSALIPDKKKAGPEKVLLPVNNEFESVNKFAVPEVMVGLVRAVDVKDELVLKNAP